MVLLLFLYYCLLCSAWGGNYEMPLFFGRYQAMGEAGTALVSDASAVVLNPAGLGGAKGFELTILDLVGVASDDVVSSAQDYASYMNFQGVDSLSKFIGKNFFVASQMRSIVAIPYFGAAVVYDASAHLNAYNEVYPQGQAYAINKMGFQVSGGYPFIKMGSGKFSLNLGFSGKLLLLRGKFEDLTAEDLIALDLKTFSQIPTYEPLIAFDLGSQLVYSGWKNVTLYGALLWRDPLGGSFANSHIVLDSNIIMSLALALKLGVANLNLVYDYTHLFDAIDWRKQNHLGVELQLPVVKLYAGLRDLRVSYGLGLNFWLLEIFYAHYTAEQTSTVGNILEGQHVFNTKLRVLF